MSGDLLDVSNLLGKLMQRFTTSAFILHFEAEKSNKIEIEKASCVPGTMLTVNAVTLYRSAVLFLLWSPVFLIKCVGEKCKVRVVVSTPNFMQ